MHHNSCMHSHARGARRDDGRTRERERERSRVAKTSERTDERTNGRCGVRVRSIYSMHLLNVVGSVSRASRVVGFPFGGARARARARVGTVSVLVVVGVSVAIDGRVTTIHLFANQRARVRRDLLEEMSTTGAAKRAARGFVVGFVVVVFVLVLV